MDKEIVGGLFLQYGNDVYCLACSYLEYMGYFIQDGILYSVKPYAVYDPNLSFPMNDYDCLTVLYEVLDLFE